MFSLEFGLVLPSSELSAYNVKRATVEEFINRILDANDPSMGELLESLFCRNPSEFLSPEEEIQYNELSTIQSLSSNTNQGSTQSMSEPLASASLQNPFFDLKAISFSAQEIAQYLWLAPRTAISDEMLQKVNIVADYLRGLELGLGGIKADGNCFCNAFLKSYETLSRKIPLLDAQENKISYLRDVIAGEYEAAQLLLESPDIQRVAEIEKDGEWLTTFNEGELLAKALKIPLRVITVNQDQDGCGVSDLFTDPDGNSWDWEMTEELRRPSEYVCIVDLGGHFVYAQPFETAEKPLKSECPIPREEDPKLLRFGEKCRRLKH